MKKFLSWISFCMIAIASIFVLASCGDKEPSAEALLNGLIVQEENTVVSGDFSVAATLSKGDTKYNLSWTSDNQHFVVAQEAANDAYVISVSRPDDAKQTATLTASLNISKNNKATKTFKVSVLPYDVYDFSSSFVFAQNGANVCGEFALPTSYTLKGTNKTCTISWVSVDETLIKVAEDGKSANAILSFEKIETKMKATFTYNGESTTKSYTVNVLQQTIYPVETELKENTPYVFGLIQKTLENNYYYFEGTMSGNYGAMSKDVNDAKDMYVEATEGGYYVYFMDGTAKKYFNGVNEVNKYIKLEDTPSTVWKWDSKYNTLIQTFDGTDYYFGTYSSYETLSISTYSYISTSFPVQFYNRQTILDSAPVFADDVMVDFEAKQFAIDSQVAGVADLQTKGKKFEQVEISYAVVEGYEELVTIENGVVTFATISKDAEVKLNVTFTSGEYSVTKEVTFTLLATVEYAKSLVEGIPYVFAIIQGNLENKTLYFSGTMNGYYGATTENAAEAAIMYVEAVTGGYNLYFYNAEGVKTYVVLAVEVKNDKTYINFTLAPEASTVWTWNADLYTLVTEIEGNTYYLGTYKTYNTVSASVIENAPTSFVGHFYQPAAVDYPAEGVAYKLVIEQANRKETLYFTGTMNGYYGATSTTYTDGVDVYVEAVTGGYNLYFKNAEGVKTYIVVQVSGTHYNFILAPEASTVWTWNAEYKTFTTVVDDLVRFIGTSGTYNTCSINKFDYLVDNPTNNFPVKFYGFVSGSAPEVEPEQPGTEPEPTTPTEPAPTEPTPTEPEGSEPTTPTEPEDTTIRTIAEALEAADNAVVELTGVVVAIETDEFILSDGTNNIHINMYQTSYTLPELGATVVVKGTRGTRNYGPNVKPTAEITAAAEAMTITTPQATVYDAAGLDALVADGMANGVTVALVSYTGTLSVSGYYFNVNVEGTTTAVGSLGVNAADEAAIRALNGKEIIVTGYFFCISSSKYVNTIVTSVVEHIYDVEYTVETAKIQHNLAEGQTMPTVAYDAYVVLSNTSVAKIAEDKFTAANNVTGGYIVLVAAGETPAADLANVLAKTADLTIYNGALVLPKTGEETGGEFVKVIPSNLSFGSIANNASADSYWASNYADWTISGKLGNGYAGYSGFGRSGDKSSSITSSQLSVNEAFTITTVLKGNGSSGVMTSYLVFTLVDVTGNIVAQGSVKSDSTNTNSVGATNVLTKDQTDSTIVIEFTLADGKAWTDVAALKMAFTKVTGNIGLKSLTWNA